MKLETSPEVGKLDSILEQKKHQKKELQIKLDLILGVGIITKVDISYCVDFTQEEQVDLAKMGLFLLTYDSMYYARDYGNEHPI